MEYILLHTLSRSFRSEIVLPASKSISNRVLLIQALCRRENKYPFYIHNLSEAEDTQLMADALNEEEDDIYIRNAGTAMRFLTAYFAQSDKEVILKGSERMNRRPVEPLVKALQELDADIFYMGDTGFPPLQIKGKKLNGGTISVDAQISSQFISALMLIGPQLEGGLTIEFKGSPVSRPYINMTAEIMACFGVYAQVEEGRIIIPKQDYSPRDYEVESDWSSASYFYALAALMPGSSLVFPHLFEKSLQGDSVIKEIMEGFGLATSFNGHSCNISSGGINIKSFEADMIHYPDLIPTMVCLCAAAKIPFHISGIHTLKHKESNRGEALKTELGRLGIMIEAQPDSLSCREYPQDIKSEGVVLHTHNDHRLVMSFSILAAIYPGIKIEIPQEVRKSFPGYWEELEKLGMQAQ